MGFLVDFLFQFHMIAGSMKRTAITFTTLLLLLSFAQPVLGVSWTDWITNIFSKETSQAEKTPIFLIPIQEPLHPKDTYILYFPSSHFLTKYQSAQSVVTHMHFPTKNHKDNKWTLSTPLFPCDLSFSATFERKPYGKQTLKFSSDIPLNNHYRIQWSNPAEGIKDLFLSSSFILEDGQHNEKWVELSPIGVENNEFLTNISLIDWLLYGIFETKIDPTHLRQLDFRPLLDSPYKGIVYINDISLDADGRPSGTPQTQTWTWERKNKQLILQDTHEQQHPASVSQIINRSGIESFKLEKKYPYLFLKLDGKGYISPPLTSCPPQ